MIESKLVNHVSKNKLNYLPIVFGSISLSEFVSSDVLTEIVSFMRVLDPFLVLPIK